MEEEKTSNNFAGLGEIDAAKNDDDSGLSGSTGKKKLFSLIIVLIILLAGGSIWAITKFQKTNGGAGGTAAAVTALQKQQTTDLLQKVGRLLDLPAGETPQIYVVQDAAKLVAQQPFWTGARDGDVALIYATARKAVVYSPSRDKIVNVGPIYFAGDEAASSGSGAAPAAKPATPSAKPSADKTKAKP